MITEYFEINGTVYARQPDGSVVKVPYLRCKSTDELPTDKPNGTPCFLFDIDEIVHFDAETGTWI